MEDGGGDISLAELRDEMEVVVGQRAACRHISPEAVRDEGRMGIIIIAIDLGGRLEFLPFEAFGYPVILLLSHPHWPNALLVARPY